MENRKTVTKKKNLTLNPTQLKTQLIVITQPPPKFANQQYGKRHGFTVAVKTTLQRSQLPQATLKIGLVYADDFSAVPEYCLKKRRPHKMLQVLEHPLPFNTDNGETLLRVRINDVSRNHRGRKFCLKLSVLRQGATATCTYTTEVEVISKHPKHPKPVKRKRSCRQFSCSCAPAPQSPEQHDSGESSGLDARFLARLDTTNPSDVDWEVCAWKVRAYNLFKSLENRIIGYGPHNTAITQCPECKVFDSSGSALQHAKDCELHRLLQEYDDNEVSKYNMTNAFADDTDHAAFMNELGTDNFFDLSF